MLGLTVQAMAGLKRKNYRHPMNPTGYSAPQRMWCAEEIYGDLANGFAWLKTQNISLGGVTPVSLIDTEIGSELVADVLGRIEHGIVVDQSGMPKFECGISALGVSLP